MKSNQVCSLSRIRSGSARNDRYRATLLALLAMALCALPVLAEEKRWDYSIGANVGWDSNPLQLTGRGSDGLFTGVEFDGRFRHALGRKTSWNVDADLRHRLYANSVSDADETGGRLRNGLTISPVPDRLTLSFGASLELSRSTYVDRETGEVFQYSDPTDPATTIRAGDRYDYETTGYFLNGRYKAGRHVLLFINTLTEQNRYKNTFPGLDRLDSSAAQLRPGVRVRLNDAMSLTVSAIWTDLRYDERPALDAAGDPVAGTQREYRYLQFRGGLLYEPDEDWTLRAELRSGGRDDTYAGYYDNASQTSYLGFERKIREKNRVSLDLTRHDTDYDSATVPFDDSLRVSRQQRFVGRYGREMARSIQWFVEGGVERNDSSDPIYAYDRDWVVSGLTIRKQ